MDEIDPTKCYNCGKKFKCVAELIRHKNRKTPCLIRDVAPEDLHNPKRCIYCNIIFSKPSNLTKHLKSCKIKNGGIDILDEKIRHEQELRIIKEEHERDRIDQQKKMQELQAEVAEMKKQINTRREIVAINNTNNLVVNGNINNIHIHVRDWTEPSIEKIKLTVEQLVKAKNMQQMFFMTIYMNPDVPENHSIIPRNQKEKRVMFHSDGVWTSFTGEDMMKMLDRAAYISSAVGGELLSGRNGLVPNCDPKIYKTLPLSLREHIDSGVLKEKLSSEQIFHLLFDNQNRLKVPDTKTPMLQNANNN